MLLTAFRLKEEQDGKAEKLMKVEEVVFRLKINLFYTSENIINYINARKGFQKG